MNRIAIVSSPEKAHIRVTGSQGGRGPQYMSCWQTGYLLLRATLYDSSVTGDVEITLERLIVPHRTLVGVQTRGGGDREGRRN